MALRATAVAVSLLALAATAARADTLRVPSEAYPDIQDAVDAASDGDTILVAAGTYDSSVTITERYGLKIRGVAGTVLDSSGIYLYDCERVTIDGIEFVDATDTTTAVYASGCTRLLLKNLRIEGYDTAAIDLASCDGTRVTKCTVVDGAGTGLRDAGSADLFLDKNVFSGNIGWAIALSSGNEDGSDGARVSGNTVVAPYFGISADGEDLRIEGNAVTLESGPGIRVGDEADAPRALVQKNVVHTNGNQDRGIDVQGPECRVARNGVSGSPGLGIIVEGDGSRIEGNSVTGAMSQGLHCDGSDLRVTANTVSGSFGAFILVRQGARSLVSRNRVSSTGGGTAFDLGQPDAVVTKNFAEGAYYGFVLGAIPMTLTANATEGIDFYDVFSSFSESQFTLSRNRFATFMWDYVWESPV